MFEIFVWHLFYECILYQMKMYKYKNVSLIYGMLQTVSLKRTTFLHGIALILLSIWFFFICLMMLSATFNNISAISWRSVLLVWDTDVPGEKNIVVDTNTGFIFVFVFLEKNALSNCIKLLKYFTAAWHRYSCKN